MPLSISPRLLEKGGTRRTLKYRDTIYQSTETDYMDLCRVHLYFPFHARELAGLQKKYMGQYQSNNREREPLNERGTRRQEKKIDPRIVFIRIRILQYGR